MIPLKLTRAHSPTKDTGRIFGWLVSDGDEVKTGQPLVEIELGRVTMELESPGNGVIQILVQRGATIAVGGTLAEIRSASEVAASAPHATGPAAAGAEPEAAATAPEPEPVAEPDPVAPAPPEPDPEPEPSPEPEPVAAGAASSAPEEAVKAAPEGALATPAARRLADELGVDLAEVAGTGPDGRILAEDVEKLVASRPATQLISSLETQDSAAAPTEPEPPVPAPEPPAAEPTPPTPAPAPSADARPPAAREPEPPPSAPAAETPPAPPQPTPAAPPSPTSPAPADVPTPPAPEPAPSSGSTPEPEPEPAAAPAAAAQAAGEHIHLGGELAADGLVDAHRAASRKFEGRTSVTDLLILVVARALTDVPELNGTIGEEGGVERSAGVHLALADASEEANQAPVVRNAPSLSLEEIAKERARLAEAAQAKQLTDDDLSGATCTFSNLGGYPLDFYVPSGAGAQIALVTTGRVMEKPISFQRMLTIRPRMWVSVALDGRGADPETGGRFLAALQRRLNELPNAI